MLCNVPKADAFELTNEAQPVKIYIPPKVEKFSHDFIRNYFPRFPVYTHYAHVGLTLPRRNRENVLPSVEAGQTDINRDFHARIMVVSKYDTISTWMRYMEKYARYSNGVFYKLICSCPRITFLYF